MASFKDTRTAILLAHDDGDIDDDEFLVLYNLYTSKNPCFPYKDYDKFDINNLDSAECMAEFRVEKNDLPLLAEALNIPEFFCLRPV